MTDQPTPEDWARLGARLRAARSEQGMSRRAFAERAGVSEKSIQVAEEGRVPRGRWPQSLNLIERGLGWASGTCREILTASATTDDQQPTREERLAALADKLCRSYTHGTGLDETAEQDPDTAQAHRRAARRLLKWIEEAPEEEIEGAFKRGYDRGREVQKRRTAQDVARLEAEVAELRQDRDPDGLRARIRTLEYALRGWDTLMMGRDRAKYGAVPDWKATAAEHLAQLVEAQRELAELKGHQPSNATLVEPPYGAGDQFFRAQKDVDRLRAENATSWSIVNAVWSRFSAMTRKGR